VGSASQTLHPGQQTLTFNVDLSLAIRLAATAQAVVSNSFLEENGMRLGIQGLRVKDLNGEVLLGLKYSTESGHDYPLQGGSLQPIPEPATGTLMFAAVLVAVLRPFVPRR
jgi:hypothetical protein